MAPETTHWRLQGEKPPLPLLDTSREATTAVQVYRSPRAGPLREVDASQTSNPQLEAWQTQKRLQRQMEALKVKLQVLT